MPDVPSSGAEIPASAAEVPTNSAAMPTSGASIPATGGGGGGGDSFQQRVEGTPPVGTSLACWWSPNGAAAANLSTGDVALEVMNRETVNPSFKALVESAGDWEIVADNIGTQTSLTSAVEANKQRRASTDVSLNFCGIDEAVAISADLEDCIDGSVSTTSGFVFFKPAANVQYQDIIVFEGNNAGEQSSNYSATTNLAIRFIQSGGNPAMMIGHIGTFNKVMVMETGFSADTWWYLAWRQTARTGSSSSFSIYAVKADGSEAWSDVVSDTTTFSVGYGDGLTFGHESSHAADDQTGWRWGPIGFFLGDIGVGTSGTSLRTIFETIEYA